MKTKTDFDKWFVLDACSTHSAQLLQPSLLDHEYFVCGVKRCNPIVNICLNAILTLLAIGGGTIEALRRVPHLNLAP